MGRVVEELTMLCAYIIGLPIFLVYIRLIYVLIVHKKRFNSSFFRLVIFCGCVDCLQFIMSNYIQRWPRFGLFPKFYGLMSTPNTLFCFPSFMNAHLQLASILGSFVLALNRFTAVTSVNKSQEYKWSVSLPYIIAILIILPSLLMINLFFSECVYIMELKWTTYYYRLEIISKVDLLDYKMTLLIGGLIVTIPTLFLHIITFRRLSQHNEKQGTRREIREQYQYNLLIMAFGRFMTDLIFVAYSFTSYMLMSTGSTSTLRNVHFYFYTMNDIISLTPGLVLIIGSRRVREVFLGKRIWQIYNSKSNSTVLVVS